MMEIKVITKGSELKKIGAKEFMRFINPIVGEMAYILLERKVTLKQEKEWLEAKAKDVDRKQDIVIALMDGNRLCGLCEVMRGRRKERHNVHFGLSVSKEYRGKGYGEMLLKRGIGAAAKYFMPHKMWIEYIEGNVPARGLYEKLGFMEVGRLREYVNHYGQWRDMVIMEFQGKNP